MTVKFAPLWDDAAKALAQIVDTEESMIADLAFKWLSGEGLTDEETTAEDNTPTRFELTPFQCSNLLGVEKTAQSCVMNNDSAIEQLRERLERVRIDLDHPLNSTDVHSVVYQVLCLLQLHVLKLYMSSAKSRGSLKNEVDSWSPCF